MATEEFSFDYGGGHSMGLFFLISGVVMVLGYSQNKCELNKGKCCNSCIALCACEATHVCFKECSDIPEDEESSSGLEEFPTKKFYIKRFARLGPLYYCSNILFTISMY